MKRLLITGAGGFVGPYLAREFLDNGYEVICSGRSRINNKVDGASYTTADILDSKAIELLLAEVRPDIVINLAGASSVAASWKAPAETVAVNVEGAVNIMEAARKLESKPAIMLIGSSEEYAPSDKPLNEDSALDASNPYGISKLMQERFAEVYRARYGMRIFCVRAFNHTGPGQKESFVIPSFIKQACEVERSGKPGVIKVGNLSAVRDFSDVRDIVSAYRTIIEKGDPSLVYNAGSGKAYSIADLLKYIVSLCRYEIAVETDPARFRPVDTPYICADNSRLARLGWKAEYEIFDTLKDMYAMSINQI